MLKILGQKAVAENNTFTLYTVPNGKHAKCSLLKVHPSSGERKARTYEVYTVKQGGVPSKDNLFHTASFGDFGERIEFTGVTLEEGDMIVVTSVDVEITYQLYGEELDNTVEVLYKSWLNSQIGLNNYILGGNIIANVQCSCG